MKFLVYFSIIICVTSFEISEARNIFLTSYDFDDAASSVVADRFDVVITDLSEASAISTIETLNSNIKSFWYRDSLTYGSTYHVLDTVTGKKIVHKIYGWYLMDISSSAYRSSLASYISSQFSSYTQFDGVFLDDVWSSISASDFYQEGTTDPPNLPSDLVNNWQTHMIALIQAVKTAAGSKLVILNTLWARTNYLAEADGMMDEGFAHANWQLYNEFLSTSSWLNHLNALINAIAGNKYYFALSGVYDEATSEQIKNVMRYCFCSFLMGVGSGDSYAKHYFVPKGSYPAYTDYYWYSEWSSVLGNPIESPSKISGKNSYKREFQEALVVVNPTDNSDNLILDKEYIDLDGNRISSIVLDGRRGNILFKYLPDFIETAVSNPPASATPGSSFSVTDTVKNQGNAPAGTSITSYYLSLDTVKDTGDILLTGSRSVPSLAINGTNTGTITVTIPSMTASGSYYLLACADDTNVVAESNEGNNCIASGNKVNVSAVVSNSDLIISTLTGPSYPYVVSPGQVINLSEATKNQGTAATAVNTVTRFYWSTNSTWDASDVALGQRTVGPLAAGAISSPVSTPVTVPPGAAAGTYYIIAKADADNAVAEKSETNNTKYVTVKIGADLIVSTLKGPSIPVSPNQVINLSEATKNQGTVATTVNTVTKFYWSTNSTLDASDVAIGERTVGPLSAGSSSPASGTVSTSVTIPAGAASGTYYIIAKADADNSVAETSETNTKYITVKIGADLVISTLTGPTTPVSPGQVINLSEATKNQGSVATTVNTVTKFYWSTNSTLDASDVALGERAVGPLGAGAISGPVSTSVTIPTTAASGTYYIIAKADAYNSVAETSETNNTKYITVKIGSDLIISTLTGPTTPVSPGQVINLSEATKNQGTVATTVNTVTKFYWSTNSAWDASDVVLGQRAVGPLGAGAISGPVSTSVTIPTTAASGTYYIIAKADADNSVAETSETNNTKYIRVKIGPDLIVSTLTGPPYPYTVTPGQLITLTEATKNQGTVDAGVSVTKFYWSTNSTYDGSDVHLGERSVPGLTAGTISGPVSTSVTVPATATTGTYYIIALADANGAVVETPETNNTKYITLKIP